MFNILESFADKFFALVAPPLPSHEPEHGQGILQTFLSSVSFACWSRPRCNECNRRVWSCRNNYRKKCYALLLPWSNTICSFLVACLEVFNDTALRTPLLNEHANFTVAPLPDGELFPGNLVKNSNNDPSYFQGRPSSCLWHHWAYRTSKIMSVNSIVKLSSDVMCEMQPKRGAD